MKKMISQHGLLFPIAALSIALLLGLALVGCEALSESLEEMVEIPGTLLEEEIENPETNVSEEAPVEESEDHILNPDGSYTSKEEVALYLHQYGELPPNFITKSKAAALGWEASKGNLWDVTDQKSIGGDRFGNREGLLPARSGRQYYECDINYEGGYRGAERIVYSDDGLVYYTPDHYESFELLYGEE